MVVVVPLIRFSNWAPLLLAFLLFIWALIRTITIAELSALKFGLIMCYQVSITRLIVELDSLIINWFNTKFKPLLIFWYLGWYFTVQASVSFEYQTCLQGRGSALADNLTSFRAQGNMANFFFIIQFRLNIFFFSFFRSLVLRFKLKSCSL